MDRERLRLVAWNCCGSFSRKHSALQSLQPDIAVISETPEKCIGSFETAQSSSLWTGGMTSRGLGVIAFNGWSLECEAVDIDERLFLPCVATRGNQRIHVVGACAKFDGDYVSPTLRALNKLSAFIGTGPAIVAGDFNGSVAFKRTVPFRRVIETFESLDMASAWHHSRDERFGEETVPTFFMHWSDDPGKHHHVDYAFVSKDCQLDDARIGSHADYAAAGLSDHAPLSVDLRLPPR